MSSILAEVFENGEWNTENGTNTRKLEPGRRKLEYEPKQLTH